MRALVVESVACVAELPATSAMVISGDGECAVIKGGEIKASDGGIGGVATDEMWGWCWWVWPPIEDKEILETVGSSTAPVGEYPRWTPNHRRNLLN